jgi:cytochrome c oxidase subunit IV
MERADTEHAHADIGPKFYVKIYLALMVLLAATVGVAYIDLGHGLNIMVALTIAITKTVLVVLYFMHVRYSTRIIWLFAGLGFLWLFFLFVFPFADVWTRNWPS